MHAQREKECENFFSRWYIPDRRRQQRRKEGSLFERIPPRVGFIGLSFLPRKETVRSMFALLLKWRKTLPFVALFCERFLFPLHRRDYPRTDIVIEKGESGGRTEEEKKSPLLRLFVANFWCDRSVVHSLNPNFASLTVLPFFSSPKIVVHSFN